LTLVDVSVIALATLAAQLLRDNFETRVEQLAALAPYLAVTMVGGALAVWSLGLNRSIWRLSAMADYLRAIGAALTVVLAAVAMGFLINRLDGVARSLPIIQGFLIGCGLVGVRVLSRLHHKARQARSTVRFPFPISAPDTETILLVGVNSISELYLRSVAEFAEGRITVAGVLTAKERHTGRLFHGHRVLGTPEDVVRILENLGVHGLVIDRIVVALPLDGLSLSARAALLELERGSTVKLEFFAENIGVVGRPKAPTDDVQELKETRTHKPRTLSAPDLLMGAAGRPYWRIKRVLDVIGAAIVLIAAAPLILITAVLVVIDGGFPIMFWQYRPGAGGRPFRLLKFRTMRAAHDRAGRRVPDAERLSPVGELLRRCRLDELPQLANVLVGSMSFVGPRPLLPVDQFAGIPERLAVRPGLTGWAQIKGGRAISASDKAALDVWYIRNGSLWVDLTILLETLRMLIVGERADAAAIHLAWRELGCERLDVVSTKSRTSVDYGKILPSNAETGGYEGLSYAPRARPSHTNTPLRDRA
jgi:lipopolysaccharide/colanic/teichoic acid biosynthesis glycosyltransferase